MGLPSFPKCCALVSGGSSCGSRLSVVAVEFRTRWVVSHSLRPALWNRYRQQEDLWSQGRRGASTKSGGGSNGALREQATSGREAGFRVESRGLRGCRVRRRGRRPVDRRVGGTKETTSNTPDRRGNGRYANSPRTGHQREGRGSSVRGAPGHGVGEDAVMNPTATRELNCPRPPRVENLGRPFCCIKSTIYDVWPVGNSTAILRTTECLALSLALFAAHTISSVAQFVGLRRDPHRPVTIVAEHGRQPSRSRSVRLAIVQRVLHPAFGDDPGACLHLWQERTSTS